MRAALMGMNLTFMKEAALMTIESVLTQGARASPNRKKNRESELLRFPFHY